MAGRLRIGYGRTLRHALVGESDQARCRRRLSSPVVIEHGAVQDVTCAACLAALGIAAAALRRQRDYQLGGGAR